MCKRMKFHCLIVPQTQRETKACVCICVCVLDCGYIILRLNSTVSRATFRDLEIPRPKRPQEPPKTLTKRGREGEEGRKICLPAFVSEGKYADIQVVGHRHRNLVA